MSDLLYPCPVCGVGAGQQCRMPSKSFHLSRLTAPSPESATSTEKKPGLSLRPVPEITAEQENFRTVPFAEGPGYRMVTTRRDPVEPVPVGTYIVMCFRVTGYDPDCDGSLMARLEQVDRHGETTGWNPSHLGLRPDTDLVIDDPDELWQVVP